MNLQIPSVRTDRPNRWRLTAVGLAGIAALFAATCGGTVMRGDAAADADGRTEARPESGSDDLRDAATPDSPLPEVPDSHRDALAGDAALMPADAGPERSDGAPEVASSQRTVTFTADPSTFPNPERGFYTRRELATDRSFAAVANTIIHSYVRLDAYKGGGDIGFNDALMVNLRAGLSAIRRDGKKVILRFAYNFGDYDGSATPHCTNADATEATILKHITQLASSLEPFKDVIFAFEAGFIGCWAEWHSSWYQGDGEMPPKVSVVQKLADTFAWANPDDASYRFEPSIAIRYPNLVRNLLGSTLTQAARDRLGNHQDCFLASDPDDAGTWGRDGNYSVAQDKQVIAAVGTNQLVGGETCAASSPRVHCTTALSELRAMHFTELNEDYEPGAIAVFKNEGCFADIQKNLGYRLQLISATYTDRASAGSSFHVRVEVANDGYASPVVARPVLAVLDGSAGSFTFPLTADPRGWKPGPAPAIDQTFTLPVTIPSGLYRLSLWLPDKAANLRADSRYSIRFANMNTWNQATGHNILADGVQIGN
jgi:cytochrome c551/c552